MKQVTRKQEDNWFINLLRDLTLKGSFSDVTLTLDDQSQMKSHRVVLAASGPFFRNILKDKFFIFQVCKDSLASVKISSNKSQTSPTLRQLANSSKSKTLSLALIISYLICCFFISDCLITCCFLNLSCFIPS